MKDSFGVVLVSSINAKSSLVVVNFVREHVFIKCSFSDFVFMNYNLLDGSASVRMWLDWERCPFTSIGSQSKTFKFWWLQKAFIEKQWQPPIAPPPKKKIIIIIQKDKANGHSAKRAWSRQGEKKYLTEWGGRDNSAICMTQAERGKDKWKRKRNKGEMM